LVDPRGLQVEGEPDESEPSRFEPPGPGERMEFPMGERPTPAPGPTPQQCTPGNPLGVPPELVPYLPNIGSLRNVTDQNSRDLNFQGGGGMLAAQEAFDSLPAVPGTQQTYPNGAQSVQLQSGGTAGLYPASKSGGVPSIQLPPPPGGPYVGIKIRF
jgi:hypothetical protein